MLKNQNQSGTRKVNLFEEVLCACTGRSCEGSCSKEHLENNRTEICISAFNPPKSRDRKIQTQHDGLEEYQGVLEGY